MIYVDPEMKLKKFSGTLSEHFISSGSGLERKLPADHREFRNEWDVLLLG